MDSGSAAFAASRNDEYDYAENANDHEWKGARTSGVADLNVVVQPQSFALGQ
jgi:hypothetical protein